MMCDVSVIPSLISPLQDVEVPPCSIAVEYAAPATPALETVLESPGYTVPEESGFTCIPGFVPVSEVVLEGEGGYLRSLEEPLPPQVQTPAVTTAIVPVVAERCYQWCRRLQTIRRPYRIRKVPAKRNGHRCS